MCYQPFFASGAVRGAVLVLRRQFNDDTVMRPMTERIRASQTWCMCTEVFFLIGRV
jgi:hypothetical protein